MLAGMGAVAGPELAAAVSNAGGVGVIGGNISKSRPLCNFRANGTFDGLQVSPTLPRCSNASSRSSSLTWISRTFLGVSTCSVGSPRVDIGGMTPETDPDPFRSQCLLSEATLGPPTATTPKEGSTISSTVSTRPCHPPALF